MDKSRVGYGDLQILFEAPPQQVRLFSNLLRERLELKKPDLRAQIRQAERYRQGPPGAQQGTDFLRQGGNIRKVSFGRGGTDQATGKIPFIDATQDGVPRAWPPAST